MKFENMTATEYRRRRSIRVKARRLRLKKFGRKYRMFDANGKFWKIITFTPSDVRDIMKRNPKIKFIEIKKRTTKTKKRSSNPFGIL